MRRNGPGGPKNRGEIVGIRPRETSPGENKLIGDLKNQLVGFRAELKLISDYYQAILKAWREFQAGTEGLPFNREKYEQYSRSFLVSKDSGLKLVPKFTGEERKIFRAYRIFEWHWVNNSIRLAGISRKRLKDFTEVLQASQSGVGELRRLRNVIQGYTHELKKIKDFETSPDIEKSLSLLDEFIKACHDPAE